eukprot:2146828-Pyramimonas_sp.AAC.1
MSLLTMLLCICGFHSLPCACAYCEGRVFPGATWGLFVNLSSPPLPQIMNCALICPKGLPLKSAANSDQAARDLLALAADDVLAAAACEAAGNELAAEALLALATQRWGRARRSGRQRQQE